MSFPLGELRDAIRPDPNAFSNLFPGSRRRELVRLSAGFLNGTSTLELYRILIFRSDTSVFTAAGV